MEKSKPGNPPRGPGGAVVPIPSQKQRHSDFRGRTLTAAVVVMFAISRGHKHRSWRVLFTSF